MKKGLIKLLLGTSLLALPIQVYSQSSSPNLDRLTKLLNSCIKTNKCDEFENLRKSLGVKKGESNLDGLRLFYYNYNKEIYLGSIIKSEADGGTIIYYVDEIAGSSNKEFTKKIQYKDGDEYLVIGNFTSRKNRAQRAEDNWEKYESNNSNFLDGLKFDKKKQAEYNSIRDRRGDVSDQLLKEDILCTIAHERIQHYHNNLNGEILAYLSEVETSPYALKGIEEGASRVSKDYSEEYYTKVKRKVKEDLIRIAGSERRLYQANRAQLKSYAERLKRELLK